MIYWPGYSEVTHHGQICELQKINMRSQVTITRILERVGKMMVLNRLSTNLGLPSAAIQAFQGMLLFFLLATDILTNFRIRLVQKEVA